MSSGAKQSIFHVSVCARVCVYLCFCMTGIKEKQVLFAFPLPYLKKRYSLQCHKVLKAAIMIFNRLSALYMKM